MDLLRPSDGADGQIASSLAWFSSPRIAVRTAFRLIETVPNAGSEVRSDRGSRRRRPQWPRSPPRSVAWSAMVTGQLNGLGVAVCGIPMPRRRRHRRKADG